VQIVDIAGLTPAQLDAVTGIYREAFEAPWEMPVAELPDFARARVGENLLGRAAALVDDGAAVGLALSNYLAEANLLHLKYLAIDPTRRSQGLGAILLRAAAAAGEAIAQAAGRDGCVGTLLEVETPDSPPAEADRRLRRRRIAFYERHGALRTGIPFPRPPWAPAEQPDWEVLLLPGRAWRAPLDGATRRGLGRALLVEGYRADPQAPWLVAYLDSLAPPD
jgi:GNAT superfamily N-acetyltransferase